MAATILSAADLAFELNTDSRTARKFLRSITPKDSQPGKGSRWGIEKKAVRGMRTKFAAFEAAENAARELRNAAKETQNAAQEMPADDENEILADDEEMTDPTDEELLAIDAE